MGVKFANSAYATLASSINSSATSITLTTGQGARFPSLGGGDYFYATLIDTSNNLEIVKCTARSTDVLTVVRGQEGTTARSYSTSDRIELRITSQGLVDTLLDLSASNLTSGTIPDARFPSTLPAISGANLTGIEQSGRFLGIEILGPWNISGTDLAYVSKQSGATGTWTRPSGCNSVLVYVTGAGGGGGKYGDDSYRGCYGASGGTAIKFISGVTSTVSWTIGSGGSGGTSESDGSATDGGASSFGAYCTGYGGEGAFGYAYGSRGGGAVGGDLNIPGGSGSMNHGASYDGTGPVSFWGTHAGGRHRPSSDGQGNSFPIQTGKWGSGGGDGVYDHESSDVPGQIHGGAGVIVIYKYS
jgi:hypothetical protein